MLSAYVSFTYLCGTLSYIPSERGVGPLMVLSDWCMIEDERELSLMNTNEYRASWRAYRVLLRTIHGFYCMRPHII